MSFPSSPTKGVKHTRTPSFRSSQPPSSPDPFAATDDPAWLTALARHSIFHDAIAPQSKEGSSASSQSSMPSPTKMVMCTRGAHLIVAPPMVDERTATLRMTSLIDAKHQGSAGGNGAFGSYKVLTSAALTFPILAIRPSPNGKLLAVVGDKQVAIVVLPRVGRSSASVIGALEHLQVSAIRIGAYYHSSRSGAEASIAKVDWHPWGEAGNSLLVLTRDGMLREYDVSRDASEPQQALSVFAGAASELQSRSQGRARSRSRSRTPGPGEYSRSTAGSSNRGWSTRLTPALDDDTGRIAASFTVGLDGSSFTDSQVQAPPDLDHEEDLAYNSNDVTAQQADWSPLTLYAVARNGDVYSHCPFLPARASIPASYLRSLASYVSRFNALNADNGGSSRQNDLAQRFVSLLLRQARDQVSIGMPSADRADLVSDDEDFGNRQWSRMHTTPPASTPVRPSVMRASAMSIDAPSPTPQPPPRAGSYNDNDDDDYLATARTITLRSPMVLSPVLFADVTSQGPHIISPLPLDLDEEREASATDILYTRICAPTRRGRGGTAPVNIIAIANDDGRLDLTLVLQPVEPRWRECGVSPKSQKSSSGRYAMSDSDSEAGDDTIEAGDAQDVPSLYVYETINLGLLRTLDVRDSATADDRIADNLTQNVTALVADPLYVDTFYVYHSLGAHAVSVKKWAHELSRAMGLSDGDLLDADASHSGELLQSRSEALTRALHNSIPSDVVWVVRTRMPKEEQTKAVNDLAPPTPITAFCVLSDVYLSYALLVLTADYQLVGIELNLREPELSLGDGPEEGNASLVAPTEALSGYTSLLGPTPFVPPKLFSSNALSVPASGPRLAGSASGGSADTNLPAGARTGELTVTPATLRFLANRATSMRTHLREVVKAGNAVQARLDVLLREMDRVLSKLADVRARCAADQPGEAADEDRVKEGLSARLNRVTLKQRELIGRTDRTLQKLVEAHSPALTQYEKAWIDELGRMALDIGVEVDDEGRRKVQESESEDSRGLSAKVAKLQHQLDHLRPGLQNLLSKQQNANGATPTQAGGLGHSQRNKVEKALAVESTLLIEARTRIQGLNTRLGGALHEERRSVGLRVRLGTGGKAIA